MVLEKLEQYPVETVLLPVPFRLNPKPITNKLRTFTWQIHLCAIVIQSKCEGLVSGKYLRSCVNCKQLNIKHQRTYVNMVTRNPVTKWFKKSQCYLFFSCSEEFKIETIINSWYHFSTLNIETNFILFFFVCLQHRAISCNGFFNRLLNQQHIQSSINVKRNQLSSISKCIVYNIYSSDMIT